MNSVGTYKWSFDRNGLLTRGDKLTLYRQLLSLQLQTISERLAKIGIWGRPPLDADISIIPIPDSAIAREAEEYAAQMYGSTLNLYCLRTYFWGALIGKADGFKPDLELLYVVNILHDLGLSETHLDKASSCCFAVTGAKLARDFVRDNGWDVTRADALLEAISLHLNLNVSAKVHGTEARLLACGAHRPLVDEKSQADPKFQTVFYYARINAREVRQALIKEKGYQPEELPSRQTIGAMLNRMGYRFKKHKKSNLKKKLCLGIIA